MVCSSSPAQGLQLFGLLCQAQRVDEGIQVAVNSVMHPGNRQSQPVVHHIVMVIIVGTDPLAPVAPGDLILPVRVLGRPSFLPLPVRAEFTDVPPAHWASEYVRQAEEGY